MSTYPTYKPSGIEWLGDIPEHWISTRVKNALVFDIGGTPSRNKMEYFDGDNLWVTIADLNNQDIITDTNEKITDEAIEDSNCKLIPKDSLLFSFKLSVGHLAFAGSDLYTNEAIAAFRPSNRLNVRFLKYLLQIEFESNANTNIYGAYLFNKETLGTAKIVFPENSDEQIAIANYLDEKTSKLDQLISNKNAQIDKLKEIRQIEINTAVTKGLDPNVTLKPSGIEWLGDIPEHWEHRRLKDYCNVNMGQSPGSDSYNDNGNGLPFYQGNADFGELNPITRIHCTDPKKIADPNDVLISVRAPVGEMNIANTECCIGRGLAAVQATNVLDKFLYYQLLVIKKELKLYVTGSTFEAVSSGDISVLRFLKPPEEEQIAIANYLDEKTSKLDKLIRNLEDQIEQLEEIRKIEIYNAVTGKIKVA